MQNHDYVEQIPAGLASAFQTLLRKVYVWMTLALVVTGLTAAYVAANPGLVQVVASGPALLVLIVAELALVWILSARIMRMSFATAGVMFVAYSVLNGLTLSFIFLAYTSASIAQTFFITAGTFAATSFVGYTTKKDMSRFGNFFFMALIGLIIASLVNIFWQNPVFYWVISYVGVLLFVGLTAYDTQKIKHMLLAYGTDDNESTRKLALLGSLTLYLDFINLFLYLLRIFGRSDN